MYKSVIGLEVHIELKTRTKIFCSCPTDFGGEPNTHVCPVCLGLPGSLPVLNRRVLQYAVTAGLALGCEITPAISFDRKNYFYPDLPRGYQISQLYTPFAKNSGMTLSCGKTVRIHEIHMEDDAGKLIHDGKNSFIDCNRCGVPLIEIVTEPDLSSGEEVVEFLSTLKGMLEYTGISDGRIQEGSMRVDVNLSVHREGEPLGQRTEMKNLSSFRSVVRAIEYERERQIEVLRSGGAITPETRRFDEKDGKTYFMREKESAGQYRYFPEPDIPPVHITEELISSLRDALPEFALPRALRYEEDYNLTHDDAITLTSTRSLADLFEDTVKLSGDIKETKYLLLGEVLYLMGKRNVPLEGLHLTAERLSPLVKALSSGRINRTSAKELLALICTPEGLELDEYISSHGYEQTSDEDAIREVVKRVIADNPETLSQYLAGRTKVFGFFVGQSMKALSGKADPELINKIIIKELEIKE
ncbi:MAG: Asp-tRNA(Asn)/Glu-tRNA(Gln) amidotransferase subunit GatB [Clostridia bacterium]|nr:Asp-tRNA(Asn)/Glu-tRNA(Gln) amidotransferase subunit GatB [Clostridia bacterium]